MRMQNAYGNKDHVGKLQNIVEVRQKQDQDVLNKFVATITDREKQADKHLKLRNKTLKAHFTKRSEHINSVH